MPQNWWDAPTPTPTPSAAAPAAAGGNWWDASSGTATAPAPAAPATPEPSHWGDYLGLAIRGAGGFLGGEGGAPGAAINGLADLLAQGAERIGGSRDRFNMLEAGTAAGVGAIPFGKAGSTALRYLKGALFGSGAGAAMDVANQLGDDRRQGFDTGELGRAAVSGGVLGTAGAGIGHGLETLLGRGGRAVAPTLRDTLQAEAERAGTITPRSVPLSEDIAAGRAVGPDAGTFAPLNSAAPAAGGITSREQIGGIDPARLNTPPAAAPAQAWWAPRVRSTADVVDVPGPIEGGLDAPRGPQNQGPAGLPGSDRVPLPRSPRGGPGGPEPPDYTGGGGGAVEPFDPYSRTVADGSDDWHLTAPDDAAPAATPATPAAAEPFDADFEQRYADAERRNIDAFTRRFLSPLDALVSTPERQAELRDAVNAARDARRVTAAAVPAEQAAAAAAEAPASTAAAAAGPRTHVPAEILATWLKLRPKWAETLAGTGVDQREDLVPFTERVLREPNARKLMGAERKAVRGARERYTAEGRGEQLLSPESPLREGQTAGSGPLESPPGRLTGSFTDTALPDEAGSLDDLVHRFFSDESGSIDPALAQRLGRTAAGALAGAGTAAALSDDENRTRNVIGAALLGAGATNPELLAKLRFFSMLGSVGAQTKNLVGNTGATAAKVGELALSGDRAAAKRLASSVFSPDTGREIAQAFRDAPANDTRWGSNSGPLGIFSRMMHAVDQGVSSSMERGGLTPDETRLTLFTGAPRSAAGKWLAARPSSFSALMPFVRTATNIAERGLEHTPGLAMLPAVRAMRPETTNQQLLARQAMGLMALLAGGTMGSAHPLLGAALGPLSVPFAAGAAARRGYEQRGDTFSNIVKAEADLLGDALPLPSSTFSTPYDPGKFIASFVPTLLKEASLVDLRDLDTRGSIFNPAIAKLPFLNDAVLRRRKRRPAAKNEGGR